jgi:hypothetical protein
LKWDYERVDWISVGVDVFGIIGDVAFAATPLIGPIGPIIWVASQVAELITIGKAWDDLEMGDPVGVVGQVVGTLVKAGRLAPGIGYWFSIGDLIYNLGKGFQWVESSK